LNKADLTAADLSKENNLTGVNLRNANLTEANLSNANLTNANLTGIISSNTKMDNAIFCHTIMIDGEENNSGCKNKD
jgi:uncharacterized protein YjbI with pentapeptide repeats